MSLLKGTITALVTPFNEQGIDFEGLCENIEFQINSGVEGLLILGTTGETPTLTRKERVEIIKTTVEQVKGRVTVIVGTGTSCTKTTFDRTEEAQTLGANCALIVTPYYTCPTQEGIYRHYQAIHDNIDIPICLYNNPKRTGSVIETETILRLSKLPRIIAIKDSTGSLNQMKEVIGSNAEITLLAGDDSRAHAMIQHQAKGLISVASNLIPSTIKQLVDCSLNGENQTATELNNHLKNLFDALTIESNPIPIKEAMNQWALPAGPCRLPLWEMASANKEILQETLSKYEDLKPTATA
ncbi:MAG: 4-hydroxy-tetrahydrodipicolinate synthase [Chlamydiota bacterium]|nr:4-hydroxy-tetrahydrodipicolinate synthase [Chlamydiota bacterium]